MIEIPNQPCNKPISEHWQKNIELNCIVFTHSLATNCLVCLSQANTFIKIHDHLCIVCQGPLEIKYLRYCFPFFVFELNLQYPLIWNAHKTAFDNQQSMIKFISTFNIFIIYCKRRKIQHQIKYSFVNKNTRTYMKVSSLNYRESWSSKEVTEALTITSINQVYRIRINPKF